MLWYNYLPTYSTVTGRKCMVTRRINHKYTFVRGGQNILLSTTMFKSRDEAGCSVDGSWMTRSLLAAHGSPHLGHSYDPSSLPSSTCIGVSVRHDCKGDKDIARAEHQMATGACGSSSKNASTRLTMLGPGRTKH